MRTFDDPDLILHVTREQYASQTILRFIVKARDPGLGLYFSRFESKPFQADPQEHFRQIFREISEIPRNRGERSLAGLAVKLTEELLPEKLRSQLWSLLGKVQTVQVISDEVWIPWELLRLRPPGDASGPGRFLVEVVSITRWPLEFPIALDLPMRRIALVVPRDSRLPKSAAEAMRLKELGGSGREVVEIPSVYDHVMEALASGSFDGLHFAGHGRAPGTNPSRSSLYLEGKDEFRPAELYDAARLGLRRPLVFLNACHTGRGAPSLIEQAGWATAFLQAGAGAFVGSHWALEDDQAYEFAAEFYRLLFSGIDVGETAARARGHLRKRFPGTKDWLAYTVFAHPMARCPGAQGGRAPEAPERRLQKQKSRRPVRHRERSPLAVVAAPPRAEPELPKGPVPGEERVHEKDGTVLLFVPGGELFLGDPELDVKSRPVRRVILSPFWIGKLPVTNEQYSRFLEENPDISRPACWEDSRFNQPRQPVVGLSWEEAQAYCRWAGLELPSEAQWERAARGEDRRPYPWGWELPTPRHANFNALSGGPTQVGSFPAGAGPYGTLDQAGNVWEWCADPWASDAYRHLEDGVLDPVAAGETKVRPVRGGSWLNPASDLHAARRDRGTAATRLNTQGFRCVWRPA